MGGGDDQAAGGKVLSHHACERLHGSVVERDRRLVEQPDGALRQQHARQAQAALLPGGEDGGGHVRPLGELGETEHLVHVDGMAGGAGQQLQVLARGELLERADRGEVQQPAEGVVAGDAALQRLPPAADKRRPGDHSR